MIIFPSAKVNIGLNILNRRADGYHNLQTIFYPAAVRDVLEVIESDELKFTTTGLIIPGNRDDNLCLKAYHLLSQDFDLPPVHIHLHKNIPLGGGLGGGSSDAAFLIRLLNEKFNLNISIAGTEGYASQLGSDCAFFIQNKPAFASQKGNDLLKIELDLNKYFLVIVMPDIHISTAEAFAGVVPNNFAPTLSELIHIPVEDWKNYIFNDFETTVFKKFPAIDKLKDYLYQQGALYSSMSGSGASVYGIFEKEIRLTELEQNNRVYYGV